MFFNPAAPQFRSGSGFVPHGARTANYNKTAEQRQWLKDQAKILGEREVLLQIQFSVSLILSALLSAFVLTRKALRKGLCSTIFVNHEILHIFFSVVAIAMESIPELMYEHNIVYNSFFIAIFINLLLMSGERLLKIKLPHLHESIGRSHKVKMCAFLIKDRIFRLLNFPI